MQFLNSWLQGIIIAVIVATIIEMILPNGNSKKYIKVVLGIYVVFNIISPVINKITNERFEISSILNINEYTKKMESYEVSSKNINIDEVNESNIKQIYINKLEKDMKSKLEDKKYYIEQVKVEIDNNSIDYKINNVEIYTKGNNKKEQENEEKESLIDINKIEPVNIEIKNDNKSDSAEENIEKKENINLSKEYEKEIKKYISSVYEIDENKIKVF